MMRSKWLKLGAAGFMSLSVLAACSEESVEEGAVEVDEELVEEPVEDGPAEEEVNFGAIDQAELQSTYLDPLGWTAAEFEEYTMQEHNMGIADFTDFTELEETVGPAEDIQASE